MYTCYYNSRAEKIRTGLTWLKQKFQENCIPFYNSKMSNFFFFLGFYIFKMPLHALVDGF